MTPSRRGIVTRWALGVAASALAASALGSCLTPQPAAPVNTAAVSHDIFQGELNLAREALARQEWENARGHLTDLVQSLGPTDELGAEGRADLAQIAFELGDYATATTVAADVPQGSPHAALALEYQGLAQLFSCDFDHAITTFTKLAQVSPSRGGMWLGMTYAWVGAGDPARQALEAVTSQFGTSDDALNARFYLAQLALWENRNRDARQLLGELSSATVTPDGQAPRPYLADLDARADNWMGRHTHLMRTFFTFDTRARLDEVTHNSQGFVAHDQRAEAALQALQQSVGACGAQVGRLATARQALAQARARANAMAANARAEYERQHSDDDGDGIPLMSDRCPAQQETYNGVHDDDGCPEPEALVYFHYNNSQIIFDPQRGVVHFATDRADILPESIPIVRQIGVVWHAMHDRIHRIRIDGYTDNAGSPDHNRALSVERANRVAIEIANGAQLVQGELQTSIERAGYGSDRPVPNVNPNSDQGRARNRRVEISIIDPPMFGGTGGIWASSN